MEQRNCNTLITVMVACLLLAGAPGALAADEPGTAAGNGATIIARSFPTGASIFLNNEYRGVTPLVLVNITPGQYMVNISMAGYNSESFTVILSDGSLRELGANLEPASASPAPAGSGSVAVDSSPGGAAVLLDGRPAGVTPAVRAALILNDIPAGSHTVTVELAGYPSYSTTVTVIRNQVVKVSADLMIQSPVVDGTLVSSVLPDTNPPATTGRAGPVPLSPFPAVAAAGLAGLVMMLRRH
jgi:hypothetical protein